MMRQRGGRIIVVSSTAGQRGAASTPITERPKEE